MTPSETPAKPKSARLTTTARALIVIFVLFAAAAAYFGQKFGRGMATGLDFNSLIGPGASASTPTPGGEAVAEITPVPTPVNVYQSLGPDAVPWDGKNRVTILLLGLDYSDLRASEGPPRSDTMLLFSFDPLTESASLLSIPRDIWVPIAGTRSHERINFAYRSGEIYSYPGGGPGAAIDTVEALIGVPINYYAQIDFYAFIRLVDEIQGVKVKPPFDMKIYSLDSEMNWPLKGGEEVTLTGEQALSYARDRKQDNMGDFGRAQRTQEVIMSIRDRILRFDMLPMLLEKGPTLYGEVKGGIRTNMEFMTMVQIALKLKDLGSDKIQQAIIEPGMLYQSFSADGKDSVYVPIADEIRDLRDRLFSSNDAIGPSAVGGSDEELVKREAARIGVYNGTGIDGMAATTASWLQGQGYNITQQDNGKQDTNTRFIVYRGKPYTLNALIRDMKIENPMIYIEYNEAASTDIAVVLGSSWAMGNPMP
ncbi:MAG TPA: LCP family protein [Bellilinea sp.]|nr:LCP family protein [Bellilinea sp.]